MDARTKNPFPAVFDDLQNTRADVDSTCRHERAEVRKKIFADGSLHFAKQCLVCGDRVGNWIAKWAISPGMDIPGWDEELHPAFFESRRDHLQDYDDLWWQTYNDYLNSSHWSAKRELVLRRAKFICEGCGINRAAEVHHHSYKHVGDEFLFELSAICTECHRRLHGDDLT